MAEPKTMEEYNARFHASNKITGFGIETSMHMPCPFCAAPSWLCHRIINTEEAMQKGAKCHECGRSAKAIFTKLPCGGTSFEIVQTGGPEMPEWFQPKMRRVDTH